MAELLAYVFWHGLREGVDRDRHEAALAAFHAALEGEALEGFHGSTCFAVSSLPWLEGRNVYEEWHLLEASFALDTLNRAAVTGRVEAPHRRVAEQTSAMGAGLFQLVDGDGSDGAVATWTARQPTVAGTLWRRQMVLGPTPEFCFIGDAEIEGLRVARRRVV